MKNFEIKNYKCFGDEGVYIPQFKDINVIIGKNNTGKSSIIDIVKFLTTKNKDFVGQKREGKTPSLIFEYTLTNELIKQIFPSHTTGGQLGFGVNHQEYGLQFEGDIISFSINERNRDFLKIVGKNNIPSEAVRYFESYVSKVQTIFEDRRSVV